MLHELYLLHLYSAQEGAYKSHCYFTKGSSCLLAINIPLSVSQIDLSIPRYLFAYIYTYNFICQCRFAELLCAHFIPYFHRRLTIQAEISHKRWMNYSFISSFQISFLSILLSVLFPSFINSLRYSVCQPVSQLFRCCFVKNDMTFLWLVVNCMREITAR